MIEIKDISLLIDRLEDLVNEGRRMPLSSGRLVDQDECLAIIDQMRIAIPQQITEARRVQQEREQIIGLAQQEAQVIIDRAREEARHVLNNSGLLREASEQSAVIADETRRQAEERMRGADEYAIRVLGELEDQLIALQTTIRNGLEILQQDVRMERQAAESGLKDQSLEPDSGAL
ncbi:MAG: ATPase [Anaerolineae bacterium]|nr:ATPase [Anaerolineae bacterium]